MANAEEGQLGFEAGGVSYTLEVTTRAERAIQKRLKRSMSEVVQSLATGDAESLFAVFFEALKKHHKDIKEDFAEDLVRPKQLRKLVGDLLDLTYGTGDEDPSQPSEEGETGSANSGAGSS